MPKNRHIALLVPANGGYSRGICQGVANFALAHEEWIIFPCERAEFTRPPTWLKRGRIDGIIAFISNPEAGRRIASLGVPMVDVQGEGNCTGCPVLDTDPEEVSRLAAGFFTQAGFTHFAFGGFPGLFFSDRRSAAFQRLLEARGLQVHSYAPPPAVASALQVRFRTLRGLEYEPALSAWLTDLPKPVAILACNDIRGQQIITACRDLGLPMPGNVSVMGVDDDEILCRLCRPTLTSIAPDLEGIGQLAASLLSRMLDGETIEARRHTLPPLRIVERQSTDITTADDPLVLAATRLIRDRACRGISVVQVCDQVGCSRSTLDSRFKKHLGRPMAQEMVKVRLNLGKRLLENVNLSIEEVAEACGFTSATYFCRFFKREAGTTPAGYRAACAKR